MKYDGYVIYSDLDGTLRNSKGEITQSTRDKIEYFQKNGGRFALATGRSSEHSSRLGIKFNAPLISVNGTYVVDTQSDTPLAIFETADNCREVFDYAHKKHDTIGNSIIFTTETTYDLGEYNGSIEDVFSQTVLKIVYVFSKESDALAFQKDMTERFSDEYAFVRSWRTGVEMLSKHAGKGRSVDFVRKYYADKIHTIICAGDFENDISMLREADIGVAVGNAIESVKAAADVIGPHHDDDAIAWIIDNIESLRAQS